MEKLMAKLENEIPFDNGNVFYRYEIGENVTVQFVQENETGNIYAVGLCLQNMETYGVELHIQDDYRNNVYYPQRISCRISSEMFSDELFEYIKKLEHINHVCDAIMEIFDTGKHKEYYDSQHELRKERA